MKICVYAISLNEIKNVEAFMQSCKEADLVLVCDTGSTDGTPEKLKELGAIVYNITQYPWRFDTARNTALNLIPADIDVCISLDLDERLYEGWREALEKTWTAETTRLGYDYVWDWTIDGKPNVRFFADKIHARHNYIWRHPCHETLYYIGPDSEEKATTAELTVIHEADYSKSRSSYLHLLKKAVTETPENDRMRFYYARELMFNGQYEAAIHHFEEHLLLSNWNQEKAASYRYIAHSLSQLGNLKESKTAAIKAVTESPDTREPWLTLARITLKMNDWSTCYWAATQCLAITHISTTYLNDNSCWGFEPYDLAALSAYYLGFYNKAVEFGTKALELLPEDERLKTNLEYYVRSNSG